MSQSNLFYEDAWPRRLDLLKWIVDGGETDRTRVINLYQREVAVPSERPLVVNGHAFASPRTPGGHSMVNPIGVLGQMFMSPFHLKGSLAAAWIGDMLAGEDFDHVCELGAGWGPNLFALHAEGLDPGIGLHGGELVPAARAMMNLLAALSPPVPLDVFPVDLSAPDISGLDIPDRSRRVLFFTAHAVEYAGDIGEAFFLHLMAEFPNMVMLHFEPIGFQIDPDSANPFVRAQAEYIRDKGGNTDLFAVIESLRKRRKIDVSYVHKDFVGVDLKNFTSILRWEPRR
ncbi:hypothetical protein [Magnetospirillum sp. SS-4]|uniref:hypothetical protein n=1 Tax=Magnetospirillum sp. SS-4 TaxID=2681465 RepID=UPI00137D2F22|nr:hypothetical protein [Magnetospirillum sp. SS-4]CAA7620126.1 hypothetical protein MTBSS4_270039 [Magnetospirillum sp. SS-4]